VSGNRIENEPVAIAAGQDLVGAGLVLGASIFDDGFSRSWPVRVLAVTHGDLVLATPFLAQVGGRLPAPRSEGEGGRNEVVAVVESEVGVFQTELICRLLEVEATILVDCLKFLLCEREFVH
jgi:hypothetical protein